MNIPLWIIQGLLALVFLFAGGMKLFAQDRYRQQLKRHRPDRELGLSRGLLTFSGASECSAATWRSRCCHTPSRKIPIAWLASWRD